MLRSTLFNEFFIKWLDSNTIGICRASAFQWFNFKNLTLIPNFESKFSVCVKFPLFLSLPRLHTVWKNYYTPYFPLYFSIFGSRWIIKSRSDWYTTLHNYKCGKNGKKWKKTTPSGKGAMLQKLKYEFMFITLHH